MEVVTYQVFIATNITSEPIVATITVTPFFTNSGISCNGNSETFTITVNPLAQVNQPINQIVCNGTNTNIIEFSTLNTLGITTYEWTNNTPSIGLSTNGTGDINAFTALNPTQNPITATITVTPTFTYNGISCIGNSIPFNITVNPSPEILFSLPNQTICSQENTSEVFFYLVHHQI